MSRTKKDVEVKRDLLRRMMRIREFESVVKVNFAKGEIPGFTHMSLGEEAVAAGVCAALGPQDMLTSTHRGHGHVIAKGSEPKRVLAEIYGRVDGVCGGRAGSMHIYDFEKGVLGMNGIIASGGGLACGAAFAARYKGSDAVAVVFMGDGATDHGATHEAMNLASVWKLPVIFVIANNGWSEGTPLAKHASIERLVDRAAAYGMPGERVDGQDATAVYAAAQRAVIRARSGQGPSVIEAITVRYQGHFEGDVKNYPLPEDWPASGRDPIDVLRRTLVEEDGVAEAELDADKASISQEMQEGLDFARKSPVPMLDSLLDHVFASDQE